MGPYVPDFYCEQSRLAVEIDGGQHAARETQDAIRTRWLEAHGCRVIRFWNNDVQQNTESVLMQILSALDDSSR